MNLKIQTIKGLIWSGLSHGGRQLSQLVIVSILAHLLSPNDFGLLAMATVFTNLATLIAELGVGYALIQKQDVEEKHYSSAFWLNIFIGLLLTIIFIFISPLIAKFYNKPSLEYILKVISFNFLIASFCVIQQSILTKAMEFKKLAIRDISAVIIAGLVGIFMAYSGFGVWSLVCQLISFTLVNAFLLWILSEWRPKFIFSLSAIKEILPFSMHITGVNIIGYFAENVDQLVIGKFLGTLSLGYYSLAYKLMLYPLQSIHVVLNKVLFPAYSKIQNDLDKMKKVYEVVAKAVVLLIYPMMLGLFVVAPEFVRVVYGEKWGPAIFLVRVFSICGLIKALSDPLIGPIRLSVGRSALHFKMSLLNVVMVTIAVFIGLNWGISGIAIVYTIFTLLWALYSNQISLPLIKMDIAFLSKALFVPFIGNFIFLCLLFPIREVIVLSNCFKLISVIAIGVVLYISIVLLFKQVIYKDKILEFSYLKYDMGKGISKFW